MRPFRTLTSIAVPLDRVNVDTDQIIPKQFLKRIERIGYGEFLFNDWRYLLDETTGIRKSNPDFELNHPRYAGAQILIANKNFGSGSSREHAAWALSDYGFRCVLAPSYADIFHSNAGKNGILLITLPQEQIEFLLAEAAAKEGYSLSVSLEEMTIHDDGNFRATFTMDPFRRDCLLQGLDDIGLSLRHADAINSFEVRHDRAVWYAPRSNTPNPSPHAGGVE